MTFAEFIEKYSLTLSFKPAEPRENSDWAHTAWTVKIKSPFMIGKFKMWFGMGAAHTDPSDSLESILESMRDNVVTIHYTSNFEEWCWNFGYDPDSRKEEQVYHECVKMAQKTRDFLGIHLDEFLAIDEY